MIFYATQPRPLTRGHSAPRARTPLTHNDSLATTPLTHNHSQVGRLILCHMSASVLVPRDLANFTALTPCSIDNRLRAASKLVSGKLAITAELERLRKSRLSDDEFRQLPARPATARSIERPQPKKRKQDAAPVPP